MNLDNFIKGWLVGDFEQSIIKNKDVEVGVKYYNSGDKESKHVHLITDEYTIVLSGKIKMNDMEYCKKDIIYIQKGTFSKFECLENAIILVIKTPSNPKDKYFE